MENVTPVSKTSIGDYEFCPWFWYAIRILKYKKVMGMPAMNGISGHNYAAKIIQGTMSLAEALDQAPNPEVKQILIATNTWWPFEELRQKYEEGRLLVEETIYATKSGKRVKTRRSALVMGIVDLAEPPIDGVARIDDWKSGKWEKDDSFERNLYAGVIGPALFPDAKQIIFTLRFMRSGTKIRSTYTFSSTGNTIITTDPNREMSILTADENPILKQVKEIAQQIEEAEPIPRHGAHCKKHYGLPCQFYADGQCPYWKKKLEES